MSKERLEEIVEKIAEQLYDRIIVPKTKVTMEYQDIKYLFNTIEEQDERVQELEDKLARIRFVNSDYDKINKRYREVIEKIKSRISIKYEQEIELSAALVGIADEIESLYKALERFE